MSIISYLLFLVKVTILSTFPYRWKMEYSTSRTIGYNMCSMMTRSTVFGPPCGPHEHRLIIKFIFHGHWSLWTFMVAMVTGLTRDHALQTLSPKYRKNQNDNAVSKSSKRIFLRIKNKVGSRLIRLCKDKGVIEI